MLPLMDVIFLILAVFFYLMLFMIRHEGIRVDLPSASNSQWNKNIFKSVGINRENQLFIDKRQIQWEQLVAEVGELKRVHGDNLVVYITADDKAEHKYFVMALDALKTNGINNVNIETSCQNTRCN